MHISGQAFRLQKEGNSAGEYEDAYWPPAKVDGRFPEFRLAVADGATETSFSGFWAQQLVRAYQRKRLEPSMLTDSIAKLGRAWHIHVTRKPLPWYAGQKIRSGAFSSLLGLTICQPNDADKPGSWTALAVGDTCLFQIRDNECIESFPLTASAEFNSHPVLIPSVLNGGATFLPPSERNGFWEHGDLFLLMTDALACWFLRGIENRTQPWQYLRDLDTRDEVITFEALVQELRHTGQLKNDDVTLFRVMVE